MPRVVRRLLTVLAVVALGLAGGGVAVARSVPHLSTDGPTRTAGTEATGTFRVADRTIRQVRYDDGGLLRYTFDVTNEGRLPLTIRGLAARQPSTRLFAYDRLTDASGGAVTHLGPGETRPLTLGLRMGGCESLSSRAGAFVTEVVVRTNQAGVFDDDVTLTLPEEIHTGSAREAFCPGSTATSRPQG